MVRSGCGCRTKREDLMSPHLTKTYLGFQTEENAFENWGEILDGVDVGWSALVAAAERTKRED